VKIRGEVGEIPISIVGSLTYDRTSEIHWMAVLCVTAEHGKLITKERKFMGKT